MKDLVVPAVLTGVPTLLILKQPDLGTALILFLMFLSRLRARPSKLRQVGIVAAVGAIAADVVVELRPQGLPEEARHLVPQPRKNILGTGWHAHHARIAIGNGGIFGQGFMRGTQNQFHFLPDQYSDFPFAVFAEDWGFLGSLVLVVLYAFLVLWSIRVAATARDRFGAVLAIGVGSLIFWHTIFNLGMVTGSCRSSA